jgi:hypothetical protein
MNNTVPCRPGGHRQQIGQQRVSVPINVAELCSACKSLMVFTNTFQHRRRTDRHGSAKSGAVQKGGAVPKCTVLLETNTGYLQTVVHSL